MGEKQPYYAYSDYLKEKYHEKVYKLPVNLPVTVPTGFMAEDVIFVQSTAQDLRQ